MSQSDIVPDAGLAPPTMQAGGGAVAGVFPTYPQSVGGQGPRLSIRLLGQPPYEVALDRPVLTMGRKPGNDVIVQLGYVSSRHGQFEQRGGEWHYVDLDSTNGTYINGQRVDHAVLRNGDILRIGDAQGNSVSLTFLTAAQPTTAPVQGTRDLGAAMLGSNPVIMIGRDPQTDIPLDATVVSWHHARIDQTPQGHVLTDLNSTNGTFVNGQRVARAHTLQSGDVVQIGPFKLVYEASGFQQYAVTGGVRLDGLQVTREVGRGDHTKRILDNISLSVYPREFIALVGTSGAGKSTLMKALSGVARAESGQVLLNGDNLYQQFDLYRTMIGYVPQDDIIHKDLKVADALRYAARLRLPPDTSNEEIERRIEQVLQDVEMLGQKDQVITSLSGGQRKRVSIAVELLAEPNLFFLDEPTSGLDPGLEKKMMYTLRRLADGGRTVVLVTHATANITQCDHVCFLAQGRMAYYGPPEEVFSFFNVTTGDFSDVYDRLDDPDPAVSRQKAQDWEQRYQQSSQYQRFVAERQQTLAQIPQQTDGATQRKGPRVNPLRQLFVLTRRYLDLVLRDKLLLTVLMVVMPIVGALILLVSDDNWLVGNTLPQIENQLAAELAEGATSATYSIVAESQTVLFMMALASVLLGLFASVYEIVKEWSVYQRERMVTLRIAPYIFSKILVIGVFALLQCLLLMLVIGLKVDYPTEGILMPAVLEIYITMFLATLAAISMGLLVSAIVPNANTVIYLVFLVLFFQMIFAGVLFDLPGITNEFSVATLTRWAMQGMGASVGMEGLNDLTVTRFQPDPITEEVSFEIEKPADDWEPVTVVTVTQQIEVPVQPGITQTVPISVPEVTINEMVTVTETVVESVTVEPDPMDIETEQDFRIDYVRTTEQLLLNWGVLAGFGLFFCIATAIVLKRKDVR
ncbi:MAG: FHA domain-containing protein [Anaerolineae bacterium]|nr:FHA domain-containing protein [Anaerolineae bacterium]